MFFIEEKVPWNIKIFTTLIYIKNTQKNTSLKKLSLKTLWGVQHKNMAIKNHAAAVLQEQQISGCLITCCGLLRVRLCVLLLDVAGLSSPDPQRSQNPRRVHPLCVLSHMLIYWSHHSQELYHLTVHTHTHAVIKSSPIFHKQKQLNEQFLIFMTT